MIVAHNKSRKQFAVVRTAKVVVVKKLDHVTAKIVGYFRGYVES